MNMVEHLVAKEAKTELKERADLWGSSAVDSFCPQVAKKRLKKQYQISNSVKCLCENFAH